MKPRRGCCATTPRLSRALSHRNLDCLLCPMHGYECFTSVCLVLRHSVLFCGDCFAFPLSLAWIPSCSVCSWVSPVSGPWPWSNLRCSSAINGAEGTLGKRTIMIVVRKMRGPRDIVSRALRPRGRHTAEGLGDGQVLGSENLRFCICIYLQSLMSP